MNAFIRLGAVALLLAPLAAAAAPYDLGDRRLALIDDPLRAEAQSQLGKEKVSEAIAGAALSKGWKLLAQTDGGAQLSLSVRDQHLMKIEVAYDAAGYRIRYLESVNLLYRELPHGLRAIHRNYNVWLRELTAAIDARLGVSVQTTVGFAPLAQADAVPRLKTKGREAYDKFLTRPTPRAFAVAPTGAYGWAAGANSQSSFNAVEVAMARCGKHSTECKLYAVDDHVVWTASPGSAAPSVSSAQADQTDTGKSPKTQASAKPRSAPASDRLPAVGSAWKYSFRDQKLARLEQAFTVRITGVDGWTVRESFERESLHGASPPVPVRASVNAQAIAFETRRMEQNYLLYEFSPYLAAASEIKSSLKVGQVPAFPGLRKGWRVKVTAVEGAKTEVPAGQFTTIRVEVTGENSVVGAVWDYTRFRYTTWYAPEVKRYVMLRLQSWNGTGAEAGDQVVRLTEYLPK
jgi:hypothetical protein